MESFVAVTKRPKEKLRDPPWFCVRTRHIRAQNKELGVSRPSPGVAEHPQTLDAKPQAFRMQPLVGRIGFRRERPGFRHSRSRDIRLRGTQIAAVFWCLHTLQRILRGVGYRTSNTVSLCLKISRLFFKSQCRMHCTRYQFWSFYTGVAGSRQFQSGGFDEGIIHLAFVIIGQGHLDSTALI